jgi:multisubunit Na+/H+ antiporter MnhB subunit
LIASETHVPSRGDLGFAAFISIIIAIALGLWYHYIRSRSEADSKLDKIKGIYFLLVVLGFCLIVLDNMPSIFPYHS